MAGGSIFCGSFNGEDKSGSAYTGVLDALEVRVSGEALETVRHLKEDLEQTEEYIEIVKSQAAIIEPLLSDYRNELIRLIGHSDWVKATEDEEAAGLDRVEAKWGKGLGWQLYCVTNLIAACRTSVAEDKSIYIVFS